MMPDIFSYTSSDLVSKLTVYPISIDSCINLFESSSKVRLLEFGATCYQHYGFVDETYFPNIMKLADIHSIKEKEGDIGIILFYAVIDEIFTVKAIDDIAFFEFSDNHECNKLLSQLAKDHCGGLLINEVKKNQGQFISVSSSGNVKKYSSVQAFKEIHT